MIDITSICMIGYSAPFLINTCKPTDRFKDDIPIREANLWAIFRWNSACTKVCPFTRAAGGAWRGSPEEASDLGLPLVGVGLLYTNGYFSQRLTEDGWQEMRTFDVDVKEAPISQVLDEQKNPLLVSIILPERPLYARVWKVRGGVYPSICWT